MEKIEIKDNKLIIGNIFAEELIKEFGSPLYVYDAEVIKKKIIKFQNNISYRPFNIHYAMKANSNLAILKLIRKQGCCIDAVSINEIKLALKAGFNAEQIIYTGNNITDEELEFARNSGVILTVDSLSLLEKIGELYSNSEICVRINPNVKASTHSHLATATDDKKFGISFREISEILKIANRSNIKIIGIHGHLGTNIFNADEILFMIDIVLDSAKQFSDLKFIDFGGGYGVSYRPDQLNLDLKSFGEIISEKFKEFCSDYGKKLELKLEPGRYIVCESGYLLSKINTIKRRPLSESDIFKVFYGLDTNMAHLIRPAMYGAYHHIVNASAINGSKEIVDVVGNVCESGDFLGKNREITSAKEGDVIAILNAGAYGFAMSSNYNMFTKPAEILVKKGNVKLIRRRETFNDLIRTMK